MKRLLICMVLIFSACAPLIPEGYKLVSNDINSKLYEKQDFLIEIGNSGSMSADAALISLQKKQAVIKGLYSSIPSPYPGILSNEISCGDEFKPELQLQGLVLYIEGYTTPRRTFGACAKDLIKYKTFIKYYYCKGQLRFVKGYAPLNSSTQELQQQVKDWKC